MARIHHLATAFLLLAGLQPHAQAQLLDTATSFAVLGASTVTNTGPTVITGNVGTWPGLSITGFPPGILLAGTIHAGDAVAMQAQADATVAYNFLAGLPPDADLSGQDLGGMVLTPGVYFFSSSAQLTGTLVLNTLGDPSGLFVFQIGSTLTTATASSVITINGPNNCNVYWQVGSSATLGTGTAFTGNIIASESITLNTGASIVEGRALALNGAVTLDTNAIVGGCLVPSVRPGLDCNDNGIPDEEDIANGTSQDCNLNGIPDECDITDGTSLDCNLNGVPDECDVANGTSMDCNANGVPDECDIAGGTSLDCNLNGIPDECEPDCNANGIPDECDITDGTSLDCNLNGIPDECDITGGTSLDCNLNGIPDECDIADGTSFDCNLNGIPDRCDIADGTSLDCNTNGIPDECELDCNANGIPDECDLAGGTSLDCNLNGIPDECDITGGTSLDCNLNGIPDECESLLDCNGNGIPDICDIASGTSRDCNLNGIPDECEALLDCNGNGIPDICDLLDGTSPDCNMNGIPDECDIGGGISLDCNMNGIPDECEVALDCNGNGIPDICDIADGTSLDCNGNGIPDECDISSGTSSDCNLNGIPDECDGGCDENCEEFNRFENLTQNDTLSVITNFHNPESDQGYVYIYAVNGGNAAVAFDWLVGQTLIVNGLEAFEYSVNALDYRAMVPEGSLTDLDGDDTRDLNGLEYEKTPGVLLVPRFIGQVVGQTASQLVLIGLSGGTLFDTTVDFLIYNDNEEEFSTEYTFRCWDKTSLLQISGAFGNQFLANATNNDPDEFLGAREYGWFRLSGGSAGSTALSIDDPAIYAVYIERIGASYAAADLPFEICTQSGHLLPRSQFGDNEEEASNGASDRDCSVNISRRHPGSLLLYPEFDNRSGVISVLTVTNTNPISSVRVNYKYIGRFGG